MRYRRKVRSKWERTETVGKARSRQSTVDTAVLVVPALWTSTPTHLQICLLDGFRTSRSEARERKDEASPGLVLYPKKFYSPFQMSAISTRTIAFVCLPEKIGR